MNLLDLYKEMYYKENEVKSRIGAKLTPNITLLVTLTTANVWVINKLLKFDFTEDIIRNITFILLLLSICENLCVFFVFYRAHFHFHYKYVEASVINKTYHKLHSPEIINNYSQEEIEEEFEKSLINIFYDCAKQNQKENLRKIKNQDALMSSYLVFLLILIACFYWIALH